MRYRLLDLELEDEWSDAALDADESGIGLVFRLRGCPVGFALHRHHPGAVVSRELLERLAGEHAADVAMAHRIRDELAGVNRKASATISIAICTRARTGLLEACLRSIADLHSADLEVLVVDNAPPDDATAQLVRRIGGARYVREPRPGLDVARNRALREARHQFVAFVDDDVVVDREWLAGLEEAIAENPDAGVITGLVLPYELETQAQIVFEHRGGFRRGFRKLRYQGAEQPGDPLYPLGAGIFGAGANMAVEREAALRLGGFDEALDTGAKLPGGGDLDMFSRMIRAGLPIVYEPRMLVFHRHRREMAELYRQYWSWGTGFMAYVTKTYRDDPRTRRKLRALVIWWINYELGQILANAAGRGWGPARLAVAEFAGGIVGLAGTYERSLRRMGTIDA